MEEKEKIETPIKLRYRSGIYGTTSLDMLENGLKAAKYHNAPQDVISSIEEEINMEKERIKESQAKQTPT